jgi:hypothetical protein
MMKFNDGSWAMLSRKQSLALAALLPLLPVRRAEGEERVDLKALYYKEDGNRMQVFAPSVNFEKEITPTLTIKIQGVYNSISGATPTGAPPVNTPARATTTITTTGSGSSGSSTPVVTPPPGEHENETENDRRMQRIGPIGNMKALRLNPLAKAGATPAPAPAPAPTPAPTPAPSGGGTTTTTTSSGATTTTAAAPAASNGNKVPTANSSDERYGLVIELNKQWAPHTFGIQLAYSTESDYDSKGLALRDAIDFNQKNTTLLLGVSFNHDMVQGFYQPDPTAKNTVDAMIGVTQLLDPNTFITANFTLGRAQGYLTDPYKVVELNGALVPEQRPEERTKQVAFLALNRYFDSMEGSAELSYRFYRDSFGIAANTLTASWFQKLNPQWTLRPMFRYYQQSAADFYAVRFSGAPEVYSADYRLSELMALGYGLKLIWKPTNSLSFDLDLERYEQRGRDGVTAPDAYPSATIVMVGATLWL